MGVTSLDAHVPLARAAEVLEARVGDVLVLHDPVGDRYVRLNSSAEAVWRSLADAHSPSELAAALAACYGLPPSDVLGDVEHLAAELLERGLVRRAS